MQDTGWHQYNEKQTHSNNRSAHYSNLLFYFLNLSNYNPSISEYYRIALEALFDPLFCYNIAENISERIHAAYFSRLLLQIL